MKMQIRLLAALLAAHASAVMLNCDHVRVDKHDFNLEKLGGPHSVVTTLRQPPSHSNTSYTVDICKPLKRKGEVPKGEECPSGTRGTLLILRPCRAPFELNPLSYTFEKGHLPFSFLAGRVEYGGW